MTTEILPVPRDLEMIDVAQQADRAVQEAEVRLEIIQRVMHVALKATYAQDWIDMGGKPYLAATGAPTVKTAFGSSTARRDWDFEVVDLSRVSVEYLLINAPAVREAIRRGVREIPGVRIYQKETLVVKPS